MLDLTELKEALAKPLPNLPVVLQQVPLRLDFCQEMVEEIDRLREVLKHSEMFRNAYRKGKLELYAKGGVVQEAAMEHLPCSEGPLEREAVRLVGERLGWIASSDYHKLRTELAKARDGFGRVVLLAMEERWEEMGEAIGESVRSINESGLIE